MVTTKSTKVGATMKLYIKHAVKRGLIITRKTLARSPAVRRAGRMVRNVLFPAVPPSFYSYAKYAPTIAEYQKQVAGWKQFKHQPTISVLVPNYNTKPVFLRECIESVLIQSYPKFELCIADDASTDQEVKEVIKEYAGQDDRIKVMWRKKNGHISAASNSALELATGEFVALLDSDDVLWPNALYEIVAAINNQPDVELIYTDEDKIDAASEDHSYPFPKPDWSPEFLESCNYITHFACIRTTLMRELGGIRVGYEGAQDWDLFMRITEKTKEIVHIPKIVYSWRMHEASTAMSTDSKPYVYEAQRKLLTDRMERNGRKGIIKHGVIKQHSSIEYAVVGQPLVSILVYGPDAELLKKAIASLRHTSNYQSVEYVVAAPEGKAARAARRMLAGQPGAQVVTVDRGTTAAAAYNQAAALASGEYLAFVDGTMVVRTQRWLELLLGDAQNEGVGAVGGKTLYRTKDKVLRAGIGLGIYELYAPLVEGMNAEDLHYIRGLYAQSRRNVSAVDSGLLMLKRQAFNAAGGFAETLDDMFIVDLCLKLRRDGLRNIYNPFVESVDPLNRTAGDADQHRDEKAVAAFQKQWQAEIDHDPYLNPILSRTNAQMEVR